LGEEREKVISYVQPVGEREMRLAPMRESKSIENRDDDQRKLVAVRTVKVSVVFG
jgi:hypothetical protein